MVLRGWVVCEWKGWGSKGDLTSSMRIWNVYLKSSMRLWKIYLKSSMRIWNVYLKSSMRL